ncbi:hypothetical protein FOZ62_008295, partial [Perkinsus olseni]
RNAAIVSPTPTFSLICHTGLPLSPMSSQWGRYAIWWQQQWGRYAIWWPQQWGRYAIWWQQ